METTARIFKVQELCRILGFSDEKIRRMFNAGEIPGFKIGSQWVATRTDLEKWLGEERVAEIFDSAKVA
ncbi:helix-turn-helix domain-containing protein [bacterium]|nr:helix-turn-helix domain-containing protein [bacterium]